MMIPAMSLTSGMRLRPYEILSPLGAGGMGEVYKAKDTRLDRIVTTRFCHRQTSRFRAADSVTILLNYFDELRRKVPTGGN